MKTGLWNTVIQQCWILYLFTGWKKIKSHDQYHMWVDQSKKERNKQTNHRSTKGEFDQSMLSRQWGCLNRNWQRYRIIGLDTRRDGQTFCHSNNGGAKNGIVSTITKELFGAAGLLSTTIQRVIYVRWVRRVARGTLGNAPTPFEIQNTPNLHDV